MILNKVFNLSVLVLLLSSCVVKAQTAGNATNVSVKTSTEDQAEVRKAKYLKGLRKVSSDSELKFADSVSEDKGITDFQIQYYSQDYQKMHRNEFKYLIDYGEYKWIADNYIDSNFIIKAKVIRPSTKEEQEKTIAELKKLLNTPTPQSVERERIIANFVGKPASLFSVVDVDSVKYDLKALKNKVVVINFWFIGCAPCQKEMPELNKLVEKYKNKDVVFLAFEVNDNSPDKIKAVTNGKFNYTQIPSKRGTVDSEYKVKTYPTSYVIDKEGIIRFGLAAYNPFKIPEMDEMIEKLLINKATANK